MTFFEAPGSLDLFNRIWAQQITDLINSLYTQFAASESTLRPGAQVARTTVTADSSTFTTTVTEVGTLTFTGVLNAVYEIEAPGQLVSTGSDIYECRLYQTSIAGTLLVARQAESATGDGVYPNNMPLRYRYVGTGASVTFKLAALRVSGAGTVHQDAGTDHPAEFFAILRSIL